RRKLAAVKRRIRMSVQNHLQYFQPCHRRHESMKQKFVALRYLLVAFAVSAALSLVCFAQAASASGGGQGQGTQQAAPAIEWPADPVSLMTSEWTRAKNWTREYLDKMPEDGLNLKPTPEIRSFAEQMIHLAGANFAYAARAAGQPNPYQGKD